jgi:hypothetical protein
LFNPAADKHDPGRHRHHHQSSNSHRLGEHRIGIAMDLRLKLPLPSLMYKRGFVVNGVCFILHILVTSHGHITSKKMQSGLLRTFILSVGFLVYLAFYV